MKRKLVEVSYDEFREQALDLLAKRRKYYQKEVKGFQSSLKMLANKEFKKKELTSFRDSMKGLLTVSIAILEEMELYSLLCTIFIRIFDMMLGNIEKLASSSEEVEDIKDRMKEKYEPIMNYIEGAIVKRKREHEELKKSGLFV